MTRPTFVVHGSPRAALVDPSSTVCVDGVVAGFRSLSHWPGNSTPAALRHDLSTGIALRWAALPPARRDRLVGPFSTVLNNHYDTDGALSAFALIRPDEALPRSDALLAAAATGDFATWQGEAALAIDLSIMGLLHGAGSPLADSFVDEMPDAERWERGYLWLLEHLPELLDEPFTLAARWREAFDRVVADVERVEAGDGVEVETHDALDLAIVTARRPLTAIGLHHAAGAHHRVLIVQPRGPRYRLVLRDESWFDVETIRVAPRIPLAPIAAALEALEGERADGARWWATGIGIPVAELGFGDGPDEDGFHAARDLTREPASGLAPATVVEVLVQAFGAAPRGAARGR